MPPTSIDARLLTRRAMVGWLLKTLGSVIAAIVPLATISAYFSGTPEQRGRLYLAVNDESYENNDGEFRVSVTVL